MTDRHATDRHSTASRRAPVAARLPVAALGLALLVPLGLGVSGCDQDETEPNVLPDSQPRVTYYDDVLPILTTRCQNCHTEGGIAPFATDDYEEAKDWGGAMATAVRDRTMPPFAVDASGECNEFRDAQWLAEDEIATIEAWVDGGFAMGDVDAPRTPLPELQQLDGDGVVVVSTPQSYTPVAQDYPGGEYEDYQCFIVDDGADVDRFLVGFDVLPGNVQTVHHVLVMEVDPDFIGNGEQMKKLDADSPDQVGWDCFGAAGDSVIPEGVPVAWAPGTGAVHYPDDTGIRIEAGHKLVMQMHYNLINDDGADTTEVQLAMTDSVAREGIQTLVDPFLFSAVVGAPESLEPGRASVEYEWAIPLAEATFDEVDRDQTVDVYGILPHMHQRGRGMEVSFDVEQEETCGAHVDRWDFNWQRMYFYEEPITMTYADSVHVTCDFDTSSDTKPVLPGFGTDDEMCLLGLYIVPRG